MNISTLIGILGGAFIVGLAAYFTAEDPWMMWNPVGLLIVFGGSLAAVFVAYPLANVLQLAKSFAIVLRSEKRSVEDDIKELATVSEFVRSANIRGIESKLHKIRNPFLRTGIQLVIDATPADDIVNIMSWRIRKLLTKEQFEADVFRSMASFAPAFGMIGTLFGLMNMLGHLGGDMDRIGANLAVALMTTLYGLLAANLIFKPIAIKLEHRTQQRVMVMNTILEGVVLIAQSEPTSIVKETLKSYVADIEDELVD